MNEAETRLLHIDPALKAAGAMAVLRKAEVDIPLQFDNLRD